MTAALQGTDLVRSIVAGARKVPLTVVEAPTPSGPADMFEREGIAREAEREKTAGPKLITLADVVPEEVKFLDDDGRIPLAMITLFDGDPGLGKSTAALDYAARVSTGNPMPGSTTRREPADVILCNAEDALGGTVRRRLDAAGADVRRIHAVVAMPKPGDPDSPMILDAEDIRRLELAVVERKAKLVIIDPFMAFLDSGIDSHKDQDIRRVLRLLATMAERTGAAVVIVRHLRKGSGPALYRGGGSIGIIGAARSAMLAAKDPDDPEVRLLAMSKSNVSKLAPTLRWRLVDFRGVARVEWMGIAEGVTADDLAAVSENVKSDDDDPIEAAKTALRELLANGPKPSKELDGSDRHAVDRRLPVLESSELTKGGVDGNIATTAVALDAHVESHGVSYDRREPRAAAVGVLVGDRHPVGGDESRVFVDVQDGPVAIREEQGGRATRQQGPVRS